MVHLPGVRRKGQQELRYWPRGRTNILARASFSDGGRRRSCIVCINTAIQFLQQYFEAEPAPRSCKMCQQLKCAARVVGVTGTIGAGKGEVVKWLQQHGYQWFSARAFLEKEIAARGLPSNRDRYAASFVLSLALTRYLLV